MCQICSAMVVHLIPDQDMLHEVMAPTIAAWNRRAIAAALKLPEVLALVEAARDLQSDMRQRAECKMDVISGEQYRVVNAGNSAWAGFCAAIAAFGDQQ